MKFTQDPRILLALCVLGFSVQSLCAQFAGTIILGRPEDTSIVANVMSPAGGTAYIEYGTQTGAYPVQTTPQSLAANLPFEFTLTPLKPNTRYYYRLRFAPLGLSTYAATPEYAFMTQRPPGSTFTFCLQGDSHPERDKTAFNSALYTRTLTTAAADKPDFFICSGDDFSVDTLSTYSAATVGGRYTLQLPYFNLIAPSAPLFLTNGNHEQAAQYLLDGTSNNVAVWAQTARNLYYSEPAPDSFYSGNAVPVDYIGLLRNYYAWTWGDALFVDIDFYWSSPQCVDSLLGGQTHVLTDPWVITLGTAQYAWLEQTLRQSTARFKFVFAHHVLGTFRGGIENATLYEWGGTDKGSGANLFAQKRPGWDLPIHQMFVKYGVTIFFQGHDHCFAYQKLDGVTYQEVPYAADPNYGLYNADAYTSGVVIPATGYARVTVSPTGVKVDYVRTYLPADEGPGKVSGSVAYSYTIGTMTGQGTAPLITAEPVSQAVSGGTAVFRTQASGSGLSYQWLFQGGALSNGPAVSGATGPNLVLSGVSGASAGSYQCIATNSAGSVTSQAATLTVAPSGNPGRLVNLSVNAVVASELIMGFVTGGAGTAGSQTLLIRAAGPALVPYGVTGVLPDPEFKVFNPQGVQIASNAGWGSPAGNPASVSLAQSNTGAGLVFGNASSLDSAAVLSLPASPGYTVHVDGRSGDSGRTLAEVYDDTPANAYTPSTPRLVNLSCRIQVPAGGGLTNGFYIGGSTSKTVLVRAVGPGLAAYGVTGPMPDPVLTLNNGSTAIASNAGWGADPQIAAAMAAVGALPNPLQAGDSALLITLTPGSYTAVAASAGGAAGGVLLDIYEVP